MKHNDYKGIRRNPIIFFLEENLSHRQMDSRAPQENRPPERSKDKKIKRLPFYLMPNNLLLCLFSFAELTWPPGYLVSGRLSVMEDGEGKSILSPNGMPLEQVRKRWALGDQSCWHNHFFFFFFDIIISLFGPFLLSWAYMKISKLDTHRLPRLVQRQGSR